MKYGAERSGWKKEEISAFFRKTGQKIRKKK